MELRDLDLNLLVLLDNLFEDGTLTRVAQRRGISQPALSAALAKLRTMLGDELFVRTNGVMQPTARALELRPIIAELLRTIRVEVLAKSAFDPATATGAFVLSMSDIGELEFLPRLSAALVARAPHMRVKTVVADPRELGRAMEDGTVDLAVGYFPDLVASAFMQQLLFRSTSVCLVRAGHPRIGATMTVDDYAAARHIAVSQPGRTRDVVEIGLEAAGIVRHVVLELGHFLSIPALVAQSDLVATLPRPLALQFAKLYDLRVVDTPFPTPPIEVRQLWHKRFENQPRLQWLRQLIAHTCQNQLALGE